MISIFSFLFFFFHASYAIYIQDPRDRVIERERNQPGKEQTLKKKEQKQCFEEKIVDAPFESNINTVVEKHLIRNYTC